ncbi:MAG TPA: gamma-glutamyl-gamma-aminobutyrate hydrolase family protein, partial [Lapillicoccus sp.]|nr:gamma-glutamyl-gamma-aminobutyrate hydrolase family protein [Lapillicoccus sp.]
PDVSGSAIVVANATDADAGFVGERLSQRGFSLRTVLREDGLPRLADAGPVDLLLLLGSEWSVHAPVDPAALAAEVALVRDAVGARLPVLAICYGAQVVSAAFGGSVGPAPVPEVGVVHVRSEDPSLVPEGPWTSFHVDGLTPPPAAEVVARNDCGVQAFVLPGLLGVQFHPEVRPRVLDDWAGRFPDLVRDSGQEHAVMVAAAAEREAGSRSAAHALVDAFLDRVATAAAT